MNIQPSLSYSQAQGRHVGTACILTESTRQLVQQDKACVNAKKHNGPLTCDTIQPLFYLTNIVCHTIKRILLLNEYTWRGNTCTNDTTAAEAQ